MFRITLAAAYTLIHIYVFWRIASVPFVIRYIPLKLFIGAGVALWAGFFLGFFRGHGGTGTMAMLLELVSMIWMAMLFLTFVSLLAADLVTGFGFIMPRLGPSLRGWAMAAGVVLSIIAFVQGLRPPVIQNYEVQIPGLPHNMDNTVLVAMSDLHLGSILGERWLAARIVQVLALRPDIVVLLGDIFEGHGEPEGEMLTVLSRLTAPLGVWAVLGNHETHGGHDRRVGVFKDAGVRVLRNRWVEVRPGFVLAGVDDLTAARRAGREGDYISRALAHRPPGAAILLSHTPWQAEKAASAGAGLMLSGHTHGGQIWPFSYVVSRIYPLLGGRYDVEGMPVIVCRGTGTWGPRMRLWRPAEILRVILRGKQSS